MAILSDEKVASLTRRLVDTVIDFKKEAERLAIENKELRAALREPSGDVVDKAHAWDAIAAKNAEINRLRAALREIESNWEIPMDEKAWRAVARFMWETARAALGGSDE